MTQFDPPAGPGDVPPQGGTTRVAAPFNRRRFAIALVVMAAAVAGGEAYRLMTGSPGGPARAQSSGARDNAAQFVKDGEQIVIPEGSPLRGKLVIAPVAEKEIQRSLVLPAVVEADPSRTVKVLPPVAGRVVELKIRTRRPRRQRRRVGGDRFRRPRAWLFPTPKRRAPPRRSPSKRSTGSSPWKNIPPSRSKTASRRRTIMRRPSRNCSAARRGCAPSACPPKPPSRCDSCR